MPTDKYERRHQSNLSAYEREIDRLYRQIITQAVAIGVSLPDFKPDKLFSFDDYPAIRKRVEKLLQKFQEGLSSSNGRSPTTKTANSHGRYSGITSAS